jgi:uncharacterized protein (DUF697 family)
MHQTYQDLLTRLERLSTQVQELRDEVRQAVTLAELDPQMSLMRARRALEFMVREVFERRVGQRAGTQPLENLLQRIVKDGYLPRRVAAYANAVREMGNLGAHSFGERINQSDVLSSLNQLTVILDWYFLEEWPHRNPAGSSQDSAPESKVVRSAPSPSVVGGAPSVDSASIHTRAPDLDEASFAVLAERLTPPGEHLLSPTAQDQLCKHPDARAEDVVEKFQWITAGTVFANPFPALELVANGAVQLQMISELAGVYGVQLTTSDVRTIGGQMIQMLVKLGLVETATCLIAGIFKATLAGAADAEGVQAVSMAYLTHISGGSFADYFRAGQTWGDGGMQAALIRQFDLTSRAEFLQDFAKQAVQKVPPRRQPTPEPRKDSDRSIHHSDTEENCADHTAATRAAYSASRRNQSPQESPPSGRLLPTTGSPPVARHSPVARHWGRRLKVGAVIGACLCVSLALIVFVGKFDSARPIQYLGPFVVIAIALFFFGLLIAPLVLIVSGWIRDMLK